MEMLSAERQHFLQSLNGLLKQLKDSLSEPRKIQADAEISEICFETRELKLFQDEVRCSCSLPNIQLTLLVTTHFTLIINLVGFFSSHKQIKSIESVLFVVKDMEGFETIERSIDDLKAETEKWIKTNFDQWRDQSIIAISHGDLTLVTFHHKTS